MLQPIAHGAEHVSSIFQSRIFYFFVSFSRDMQRTLPLTKASGPNVLVTLVAIGTLVYVVNDEASGLCLCVQSILVFLGKIESRGDARL